MQVGDKRQPRLYFHGGNISALAENLKFLFERKESTSLISLTANDSADSFVANLSGMLYK